MRRFMQDLSAGRKVLPGQPAAGPGTETEGGREVVPQPDGAGPSSTCSRPPRCSSRAGSQLSCTGRPLKVTDWTYWARLLALGSTKPDVSMASSSVPRLIRDWEKEGALSR